MFSAAWSFYFIMVFFIYAKKKEDELLNLLDTGNISCSTEGAQM